MAAHTAICQSCNEKVSGEIYHLGFSDMDALYCSLCPRVLLLKDRNLPGRFGIDWPHLQAQDPGFQFYNRHLIPAFEKIEALFKPCVCGGNYGYLNPPRCPECNGLLRGNLYEDKPILKSNDLYVFVTTGTVAANEHLRPEYAESCD